MSLQNLVMFTKLSRQATFSSFGAKVLTILDNNHKFKLFPSVSQFGTRSIEQIEGHIEQSSYSQPRNLELQQSFFFFGSLDRT